MSGRAARAVEDGSVPRGGREERLLRRHVLHTGRAQRSVSLRRLCGAPTPHPSHCSASFRLLFISLHPSLLTYDDGFGDLHRSDSATVAGGRCKRLPRTRPSRRPFTSLHTPLSNPVASITHSPAWRHRRCAVIIGCLLTTPAQRLVCTLDAPEVNHTRPLLLGCGGSGPLFYLHRHRELCSCGRRCLAMRCASTTPHSVP